MDKFIQDHLASKLQSKEKNLGQPDSKTHRLFTSTVLIELDQKFEEIFFS